MLNCCVKIEWYLHVRAFHACTMHNLNINFGWLPRAGDASAGKREGSRYRSGFADPDIQAYRVTFKVGAAPGAPGRILHVYLSCRSTADL